MAMADNNMISLRLHTSFLALIFVAIFFFLSIKPSISNATKEYDMQAMKVRFEKWLDRNGRRYNDLYEWDKRFKIYQSNVKLIDYINSQNYSYTLTDNRFADMTDDEFRANYLGYKPPEDVSNLKEGSLVYENLTTNLPDLPDRVDWRDQGAVTPVKNQGHCGSCWAFAAVAVVESRNQIESSLLYNLSEQQLVDCVSKNHGCTNGNSFEAFKYLKANGGITTEEIYPYVGVQNTCDKAKASQPFVPVIGCELYHNISEWRVQFFVASYPVAVGIDAGDYHQAPFRFYKKGVFTGPCGSIVNHEVTIVGYGEGGDSNEEKYWILKNSWGTGWGEEGYMRLGREFFPDKGLCGITQYVTFARILN